MNFTKTIMTTASAALISSAAFAEVTCQWK